MCVCCNPARPPPAPTPSNPHDSKRFNIYRKKSKSVFQMSIAQRRSNNAEAKINFRYKKVKRKVQGVLQSQTAALPRPQEEEETDKSKQAQTEQRTKSTKISSLFPKRGNRSTKRTEKHKNKMTHGKTYNKSPRRINHKATKSKTNTGTTALERSVEQTTGGGGGGWGEGGLKHFYCQLTSPWVPMLLLIQKYMKIRFA